MLAQCAHAGVGGAGIAVVTFLRCAVGTGFLVATAADHRAILSIEANAVVRDVRARAREADVVRATDLVVTVGVGATLTAIAVAAVPPWKATQKNATGNIVL